MAEAPEGGMDQLVAFFDALVPPDRNISVSDVDGNEYPLPSALSARRQIALIREINALQNLLVDDDDIAKIGALFSGGIDGAGLVAAIATAVGIVSGTDAILDALEKAFTVTHPKVVEQARVNCGGMGGEGAADLFSIEDMLGGLVPFFIRLLKKGSGVMGALEKTAPTEQARIEG